MSEDVFIPVADRLLVGAWPASTDSAIDVSPGRRMRVFAGLVGCLTLSPWVAAERATRMAIAEGPSPLTYAELLEMVATSPACADARERFGALALRSNGLGTKAPVYTEIPADGPMSRDADLPECLQDLADEINEDVREACFAFNDPNLYYPGVDGGIEPVPDEHVRLVIWALQRELNRELRSKGGSLGGPRLPAAPLADLPWRIQRALAERRRLRYAQWGIGRAQWEANAWSLWDVPEDADYVPRRARRLAGAGR